MSKPDSIITYEAKALAFYKRTHRLAPGKDVPAAIGRDDMELREKLWEMWYGDHGRVIEDVIAACWEIFGEKSE